MTLLVVVAILTFAIFVAALGGFGSWAQDRVEDAWEAGRGIYYSKQAIFDLAFFTMGALGSALGALFMLYKSWYYAELNLPHRLDELMEDMKHDSIRMRQILVPVIQSPLTLDTLPRAADVKPNWLAALFGRSSEVQIARKELAKNRRQFESAIPVLSERINRFRLSLATSKLDQALALAHEADAAQDTASQLEKGAAALEIFESVCVENPEDLDALQLCARQYKRIGRISDCRNMLGQLREVAKRQGNIVYAARAARLIAEIDLSEATGMQSKVAARDAFKNARLELERSNNSTPEARLEYALILEWLCRANLALERFKLVGDTASDLRKAARHLHGNIAIGVLSRLDEIEEQVRLAKSEGEGVEGD